SRLEQGDRGGRRHEALAAQLEQADAERVGELPQVAGDGRLGDAQRLRGARRAAEPDDGLEGSELRQRAVAQVAPQGGEGERSRHCRSWWRERQRSRSCPKAPEAPGRRGPY